MKSNTSTKNANLDNSAYLGVNLVGIHNTYSLIHTYKHVYIRVDY